MENRASNKIGKYGVYVCPTGVEDTSDYFQELITMVDGKLKK